MNRRMKEMSHFRGWIQSSRSMLSVAIAIDGKSVSRLVSNICLGSNGRNGSSKDAPAMLNILPKLALVAIKMYLMVLVNTRRPSFTPFISTDRSLSSSTRSAASLATSTAVFTDMPTSAARSALASLMPSPIYPVTKPAFLSASTILSFWLGSISANICVFFTLANNASSVIIRISLPVNTTGLSRFMIPAICFATNALSPVITFRLIPRSFSCFTISAASFFTGS